MHVINRSHLWLAKLDSLGMDLNFALFFNKYLILAVLKVWALVESVWTKLQAKCVNVE